MNFLPNTLKHTLSKFEPFADQDPFDVAYIFVHILKLYFLFALFLIMLCNRYALLRLAFPANSFSIINTGESWIFS